MNSSRAVLAEHVVADLGVEAGVRPQLGHPERVREEAASATGSASVGSPYLKPKLMTVTCTPASSARRTVSAMVVASWWMLSSEVSMTMSLDSRMLASRARSARDAVEEGAVALQRMRAAHRSNRRTSAASVASRKTHAQLGAAAQRLDHLAAGRRRSRGPRTSTTAAILRQRRPGALGEVDQRPQHLRRQVVDDVPAQVFERVRDRRSAGPRHPGDDQHFLLLVSSVLIAWRLSFGRASGLQPIELREVARGWPPARLRVRRPSPRRSPRASAASAARPTRSACSSSLTARRAEAGDLAEHRARCRACASRAGA